MSRSPIAIAPRQTSYTPPLHHAEISGRALVIDTETTGRSVTSEIIEVAICDLNGNMVYESLVRPTASVPRAAARIHGLTTEMLVNSPTWNEVWQDLLPLIACRTLIAWNASYDRRMVEFMTARYRLELPIIRWRCAMQYVKEQMKSRRGTTLSEACRHFGVEMGTHRAATDAVATAKLLQKFLCDRD